MGTAAQTVNEVFEEIRDGQRYSVRWSAEIIHGQERVAIAQLIDISHSGVAFRTASPLNLGQQYELVISGVGEFPCTILRCSGGVNFAARFNINYDGKRRLDARITEKLAEENNMASR